AQRRLPGDLGGATDRAQHVEDLVHATRSIGLVQRCQRITPFGAFLRIAVHGRVGTEVVLNRGVAHCCLLSCLRYGTVASVGRSKFASFSLPITTSGSLFSLLVNRVLCVLCASVPSVLNETPRNALHGNYARCWEVASDTEHTETQRTQSH